MIEMHTGTTNAADSILNFSISRQSWRMASISSDVYVQKQSSEQSMVIAKVLR